jgi:hypothetical protein
VISTIRQQFIRVFAVAVACASLGSLAFAGSPADAAPARSQATTAVASDWAPGCLTSTPAGYHRVLVRNTCGYPLRAKVIISWGGDGACYSYPAGSAYYRTWGMGGFDGLKKC